MTDPMTRLREEIDAEITENLMTIEVHQSRVQALREVLERMDRIEGQAEDEIAETAEPKEPRAPRRDVRGAVIKSLVTPCRLPMLKDAVEALIGTVTESALVRALDAMLAQGLIVRQGDLYARSYRDFVPDRTEPVLTAAK